MIIIGYQGIGKSTLAAREKSFIDLESSIYYHEGVRPENWHVFYCKTAELLSGQGYDVFVSSHKPVRDYFSQSGEDTIVVCPAMDLKEKWITRLEERYRSTGKDKDFRAWQNAVQSFDENIDDLMNSGFPVVTINSMKYSLKQLVRKKKERILCFELSMPHVASWNGRWSGEKDVHVIMKSSREIGEKRCDELDGKSFFYRWDDGWCACVSCRIIDGDEGEFLRRVNRGFCGYDWMVKSIIKNNEIVRPK